MLFNSLPFLLFFTAFYILYVVSKHKFRNIILLIGSYFFYTYWDYRFLSLILILTVANYIFGIKIHQNSDAKKKKYWLILSIVTNLIFLIFFKYCNFFIENIENIFQLVGFTSNITLLHILLPLGISFYTFRILSYSIDIYRGEILPTRRFFDFATYIAFFPLIIAGPIERAKTLLPQISGERKISSDHFYEGGWLIFYGFFKKVFIADNLAKIVAQIFITNGMNNGVLVLIGCYAFAFQIYADFSGYTDIARGISRLMGFDIMRNFSFPYLARNPSDFWRRWHISLSTWFRDYVYIPLGGNRGTNFFVYRNLLITMILVGFWHGASWTFIIWGLYHGILLVLYRVVKKASSFTKININQRISFLISVIVTFHLICLGWLIFRVESFVQLRSMLSSLIFNFELIQGMGVRLFLLQIFGLTWLLILIDSIQFRKSDIYAILKYPTFIRFALYVLMLFLILVYGVFGEEEFIYLRF